MNYVMVAIVAGALGIFLYRVSRRFLRFRGTRLILCPENSRLAAVELASWQISVAGLLGKALPRVRNCSRWPARAGCDEACVKQIGQAPAATRIETIVTEWCHDQSCRYCGAPLKKVHARRHDPHLIDAELRIFEWKEVPAEQIPQALRSCEAICENCVIAETHTW